jgi:hypothetical protein
LVIAAACGPALAASGVASAQEPDSKAVCVSAYEKAQELRQRSQLVAARDVLFVCSRQECPALVRADCGNWREEVERAIPSVIVQAKVDGAEATDVKVFIDGAMAKAQLDGKAIPVDPGSHKFRFETPGVQAIETTVVIREGEHYRPIPAEFVSPKVTAPPARMTRPVPLPVWILGGVAVVGSAGFATFGIVGNQQKLSLQNRGCAPFCATSDVNAAQRSYMAADISLGVGALALATGAVFFFLRPEVPVRVGVVPFSSGLSVSTSSDF